MSPRFPYLLRGYKLKKQITHVSVVQTAKVFAVLSLITSIPFWLLMAMPGQKPPFFSGMFIFMPVIYGLCTFVFVAVAAWIYNIVVKYTGGIEFTSVEVGGDA